MTVDVAIPWRDTGCEYRARNWEWVQRRWAMQHPSWRVVIGDSDPSKDFVIPAALNDAIDRCTADIVIVSSADSVMSSTALRHAAIHAEVEPWVMANNYYVRHGADEFEGVFTLAPDSPNVSIAGASSTRAVTQLGWGVLAFRREAFEQIHYDERLTAAWEDSQIGATAGLMLGEPFHMRSDVVLLWHPPAHRAHHPDYPDGGVLYSRYRKAYFGKDRGAMQALLAEGRRSWQSTQV